jgi:hypothetical protein
MIACSFVAHVFVLCWCFVLFISFRYVSECIKREDITWLPNEAALSLRECDTREVSLNDLDDRLTEITARLDHSNVIAMNATSNGTSPDMAGGGVVGGAGGGVNSSGDDIGGGGGMVKGGVGELRQAVDTVRMDVADMAKRLDSLEHTVVQRLDMLAAAMLANAPKPNPLLPASPKSPGDIAQPQPPEQVEE